MDQCQRSLDACGACIQSGVSSTWPMITKRIVLGLGMAYIDSTCLVILVKVAFSAVRGRFLATQPSSLNFEILLAYLYRVRFGFSNVWGAIAWPTPVALQCVLIVPIGFLNFRFTLDASGLTVEKMNRSDPCAERSARTSTCQRFHNGTRVLWPCSSSSRRSAQAVGGVVKARSAGPKGIPDRLRDSYHTEARRH
jgi:hypothetical protein